MVLPVKANLYRKWLYSEKLVSFIFIFIILTDSFYICLLNELFSNQLTFIYIFLSRISSHISRALVSRHAIVRHFTGTALAFTLLLMYDDVSWCMIRNLRMFCNVWCEILNLKWNSVQVIVMKLGFICQCHAELLGQLTR